MDARESTKLQKKRPVTPNRANVLVGVYMQSGGGDDVDVDENEHGGSR